jgi:hypothetical protein
VFENSEVLFAYQELFLYLVVFVYALIHSIFTTLMLSSNREICACNNYSERYLNSDIHSLQWDDYIIITNIGTALCHKRLNSLNLDSELFCLCSLSGQCWIFTRTKSIVDKIIPFYFKCPYFPWWQQNSCGITFMS